MSKTLLYNYLMFSDIIIFSICVITVLSFIALTVDTMTHDDYQDLYDDEVAQ